MIGFTRQTARMSVAILVGIVLGLSGAVSGQATRPAESPRTHGEQQGRIKGDNVYVRSGSHQNYYAVTKLNRGDPVTVVGGQYGWLEILPPTGTFSLVEKTYVDRTGDTGKLNGERWVYAGSALVDRHYAKQVQLHRGAEVRIVGESPDGSFLKIEPPEGAHLWVKADFVEGVTLTGEAPAVKTPERVAPGELELEGEFSAATTRPSGLGGIVTRSSTTRQASRTASRTTGRNEKPGPVKATEKYQTQIDAIEAEIAAVHGKPGAEEALGRIISKLEPIANQKEDDIASLYAATRIKQIRGYLTGQAGVRKIDELREEAIRNADKIAAERPFRTRATPPTDDIMVRGEIRVSAVYEGAAGQPRRWRIVDPEGGATARTLAYIELPPGSAIDPVAFYGKMVGIRASSWRVSNAIPPIPIYTVSEIVVLDRDSDGSSRVGGSTAYASPNGRSVPPPASQPSAAGEDNDSDEVGKVPGDSTWTDVLTAGDGCLACWS
jgi:hypothetical protein